MTVRDNRRMKLRAKRALLALIEERRSDRARLEARSGLRAGGRSH